MMSEAQADSQVMRSEPLCPETSNTKPTRLPNPAVANQEPSELKRHGNTCLSTLAIERPLSQLAHPRQWPACLRTQKQESERMVTKQDSERLVELSLVGRHPPNHDHHLAPASFVCHQAVRVVRTATSKHVTQRREGQAAHVTIVLQFSSVGEIRNWQLFRLAPTARTPEFMATDMTFPSTAVDVSSPRVRAFHKVANESASATAKYELEGEKHTAWTGEFKLSSINLACVTASHKTTRIGVPRQHITVTA